MGLFDFFPYTSGHTLNLDWIIKQVKGFSSALAAHVDNKSNPHNVTAEQVGARPDTWLPSIAQIGAAPAGYGLGEVPDGTFQATPGNIDTLLAPGWYNYYDPAYGSLAGLAFSGGIMIIPRFSGVFQYFFPRGSHGNLAGCYAVREYADGVWGEWCIENPPMVLGVEYRTTERFEGKAVYTKLVDFGALPDNSNKVLDIGVDTQNLISIDGIVSQNNSANRWNLVAMSGVVDINAKYNEVRITTNTDLSAFTAMLRVKYYK